MAISDAIAALFGRRRIRYYEVSAAVARVHGMTPTELYRKQPALRAVVSFLADNIAGTPIKCYERAGDTDRPRDTTSPLARLIARPSRAMTTYELMRATASDMMLYGNALWVLVPDAEAPSDWQLRIIPWSWVSDTETEDGLEASSYTVTNPITGGRATFDARDCIRFGGYDPRGDLCGPSPVDALKEVLAEQVSAWNFRNSVWRNGGRVTQYLTRPLSAPDWSDNGGKARFAKSWKERFSGEHGDNTGGTPLLEDGMELRTVTFNAREAEWAEATRLTREDVSAVYHVNPALIWHTDGQTYASARDNARALYSETLTPEFTMIEQRINAFLVPMLGMDPATHYCEFDLSAKLAASFEEQASVLQSSVGGPWMLRNEARARLNLPAIEGGDELIVPLNVVEGGLASPKDTDPTVERYSAAPIGYVQDGILYAYPQAKAIPVEASVARVGGDAAPFAGDAAGRMEGPPGGAALLKSVAEPPEDLVDEVRDVLERFLERQSRRVPMDIAAAGDQWDKAGGVTLAKGLLPDAYPDWWDAVRWDRELADDLYPIFRAICDLRGVSAMADIGEDASTWDSARTSNFVRAMAERRADLFNEATYQTLVSQLLEFDVGDPKRITAAERAFLDHAENRAIRGARTFATAVSGFATKEAVHQVYPRDTDEVRRTKTWHHNGSRSPRADHVAMDGETVGLDERFSNGADYPGDLGLSARDAVNCHCTMSVAVRKLYGGMNVEVDSFTPCLVRTSDGEIVQTAVSVMSRRDARAYREDNGWYINWNEVPDDYTIFKLTVSGEEEPQGLLAAKDDRANQAVRLHWGVAAPWNQGKLVGSDRKRYEGVGGHLFAIGADLSMKLGYNGFMVSQAANRRLLRHYVESFGAYPIGNTLGFFIDELTAARILEEYTWE